jgi:asparagine synthase (glutamine-hydrolysing)
MCGIAGLLNLDGAPAQQARVKAMCEAVAHRGPDGEGIFIDGPAGLGHRRLAIIDLSPGGRQPMQSADGRFTLSYNGEIYNFQELRTVLQSKGYRFQSRSDTEVLLAAWVHWGPKSLARFNGMFAFALWDAREKRLVLARDRFGVKPLYYCHVGQTLLFASEVKALLAHGAAQAELDARALAEYMTFQNFFTERTLFKGVRLLPAGAWLEISPGMALPNIQRYWDYEFVERPLPAGTTADYASELDRLFRQAVSRQLVSDVDVAAYLSGGIDSGSIAAVAAEQLPYLRTFTVGFDLHSASGLELAMDERREAEQMSYLFKSEHYEMVLKAGDMERCMRRLVWHLEEPRVGQSYPNFYAAHLASKFVKVVLAGTGGDELFGGYPWRYYRAVVNDDFEHYVDKYLAFWQRLVPPGTLERLLAPIAAETGNTQPRDIFRDVFHHHAERFSRPEDYVNHSLYFEAKTFLHGLLVVEDKLSMAHGLESRVPFLDNDLVDFAMRLPVSMKLGQLGEVARLNENEPGSKTAKYFEKTRDGKLLLRQVMKRYVPESISQGEKRGFSAPDASWFRGDSIEYVKRLLGDKRARIYDYLDRTTVQALVGEHLDGRQNRRLLIWSLLYLEEWCSVFLDGQRPEPGHGGPH